MSVGSGFDLLPFNWSKMSERPFQVVYLAAILSLGVVQQSGIDRVANREVCVSQGGDASCRIRKFEFSAGNVVRPLSSPRHSV